MVVLCNERIEELPFTKQVIELPIHYIPFPEYHFDICEEGDLVVIDDISDLSHPLIEHTISVGAHHYKLASLLLVTHSLLGSGNYHFLDKIHRIFLFLRSQSNIRLFEHILRNFFPDPEVKATLKSILQFLSGGFSAEVLALEINSIASSNNFPILGFSHINSLVNDGFCIVYAMPMISVEYDEDFNGEVDANAVEKIPFDSDGDLPNHALIAVPFRAVLKAKQNKGKVNDDLCDARLKWITLNDDIKHIIRDHFPLKRVLKVTNLARAILANKKYCITENGTYIYIHGKPSTKVAFVDFASVATRRAGPKELETRQDPDWKLFKLHVQELMKDGAPKDIFLNKLLWPKRLL